MTATTGTTGRAAPPAAISDKTTSTRKIAIVAGLRHPRVLGRILRTDPYARVGKVTSA
jgi:hypothetical protein